MKPSSFEYYAAASIDHAISLMDEHGDEGRFIAGGQSLVPMMNFRVAAPPALIDLNGVSELSEVRFDTDGALHVGAMTRTRRLETDPGIAAANPLLAAATVHVAHTQIRNRGTIGGSIAHADPAAKMPGIVLACDAEICLRGSAGASVIKAANFFEGVFTTALQDSELIEKIYFPPWPQERCWGFQEISRREGDFALVGVAAWFDTDASGAISACRVVAIGVGDTPCRLRAAEDALTGSTPSPSLFEAAAGAIATDIDPFDDVHASADYRRDVAAVLVTRTLTDAWERSR